MPHPFIDADLHLGSEAFTVTEYRRTDNRWEAGTDCRLPAQNYICSECFGIGFRPVNPIQLSPLHSSSSNVGLVFKHIHHLGIHAIRSSIQNFEITRVYHGSLPFS